MEAGGTFGRYTVLTLLESGPSPALIAQWAAEAGFARLVVIKSLFPKSQQAQLSPRLESARRAAALHHPNIRQIHELGEAEERCYLAAEYLEGVTYDHLLRGRNRAATLADPRLHVTLLAQACEGLHHAHGRLQMVHGSLRPNRLFVTSGGTIKVVGLGLTDLLTATASAETLADPDHYAYFAPEQILGRPLDPRTDVFAMGVIAWEALTGRRLFARKSRHEVYRAITDKQIPRPGRLARGLPPRIDAAVSRALALSPDDRFRTTRELGVALEEGVTELGAPLSTVAIAAAVDTHFNREIEGQRTLIQRARQQLITAPDDDIFDVPTSLFGGSFEEIQATEEISLEEAMSMAPPSAGPMLNPLHPPMEGPAKPTSLERPARPAQAAQAPPASAPLEPDPAPSNGAPPADPMNGRPGFARPPETLSDVSDIADVRAALGQDFQPVNTAESGGEEPAPLKAKSGGRGFLVAFVVLLLLGAAGASGYYYWTTTQAEAPPAPVSVE